MPKRSTHAIRLVGAKHACAPSLRRRPASDRLLRLRAHRTGAPPTHRPPHTPGVAIKDPAARTETALSELYAFYGRTQGMYGSLLHDEPQVPIVQRLLRDCHGYLYTIEGVLMAGRGLRGHAVRRTRAVIGHALAFPTWRSLTHARGLTDDDAVTLMCPLVDGAAAHARAEP